MPQGGGTAQFLPLDLASLESTKAFADAVNKMSEPLQVLMCNAGIMTPPFSLTVDGYESQFQCNYLSHYFLTMLLVDRLKASPDGARVVNVSSISAAASASLCDGGALLAGRFHPVRRGQRLPLREHPNLAPPSDLTARGGDGSHLT